MIALLLVVVLSGPGRLSVARRLRLGAYLE